jgi:hypothetical protein
MAAKGERAPAVGFDTRPICGIIGLRRHDQRSTALPPVKPGGRKTSNHSPVDRMPVSSGRCS